MSTLFDEVAAAVSCRDLLAALGREVPEGTETFITSCLLHPQRTPGMQVRERGFTCFECGASGGVIDLAALHLAINGKLVSPAQAARWLRELPGSAGDSSGSGDKL